jgi:hypothetical protein
MNLVMAPKAGPMGFTKVPFELKKGTLKPPTWLLVVLSSKMGMDPKGL